MKTPKLDRFLSDEQKQRIHPDKVDFSGIPSIKKPVPAIKSSGQSISTPLKVKTNEGGEESHNVMTSSLQDVNYRDWKDVIENTETHNSSLRLTNEENYAVEDLVNDLKRKLKIKTSLNEIARLGILYIIKDFKKNREKSLVYKVKKS